MSIQLIYGKKPPCIELVTFSKTRPTLFGFLHPHIQITTCPLSHIYQLLNVYILVAHAANIYVTKYIPLKLFLVLVLKLYSVTKPDTSIIAAKY